MSLGRERDQMLFVGWINRRVEAEKTYLAMMTQPDIPVTMVEQIDFETRCLDRALSLAIGRSRQWGDEECTRNGIKFLSQALTDIRSGQYNGTREKALFG